LPNAISTAVLAALLAEGWRCGKAAGRGHEVLFHVAVSIQVLVSDGR